VFRPSINFHETGVRGKINRFFIILPILAYTAEILPMWKKISAFILIGFISFSTLANESFIRKTIEEKMGSKVSSITKTPYLNLYEVYVDGQILYTDDKVSAIIIGAIIDGKTDSNYTAQRIQKLNVIRFSDLPLDLAIKQVRGNGKRVIASFEDPNCGFCKRLAKELASITNVTHYVFLYPILSPDSMEKSRQIWCSTNRAKAWSDYMLNGKVPVAKGSCDTGAIQKLLELGRNLNITGAPTIFFANGERNAGMLPAAEIENKLNQAAKGK